MKNIFNIFVGILIICIMNSCKKDPVPPSILFEPKAPLPKGLTYDVSLFSIEEYIYVCFGSYWNEEEGQSIDTKEVWRYNSNTNEWIRKNDFPGHARSKAISFSLNNFGYIGLGYNVDGVIDTLFSMNEDSVLEILENEEQNYLQDFWKYDPSIDTWNKLKHIPIYEEYFQSFVIEDKAYVTARSLFSSNDEIEIWEYNPLINSWMSKGIFQSICNMESPVVSTNNAAYLFDICNRGPITRVILKYDNVQNNLTEISSFPNDFIVPVLFHLNNKLYVNRGWMYEFDLNTKEWKKLNGSILGSGKYAITANSKAYILGEQGDFWEFIP